MSLLRDISSALGEGEKQIDQPLGWKGAGRSLKTPSGKTYRTGDAIPQNIVYRWDKPGQKYAESGVDDELDAEAYASNDDSLWSARWHTPEVKDNPPKGRYDDVDAVFSGFRRAVYARHANRFGPGIDGEMWAKRMSDAYVRSVDWPRAKEELDAGRIPPYRVLLRAWRKAFHSVASPNRRTESAAGAKAFLRALGGGLSESVRRTIAEEDGNFYEELKALAKGDVSVLKNLVNLQRLYQSDDPQLSGKEAALAAGVVLQKLYARNPKAAYYLGRMEWTPDLVNWMGFFDQVGNGTLAQFLGIGSMDEIPLGQAGGAGDTIGQDLDPAADPAAAGAAGGGSDLETDTDLDPGAAADEIAAAVS